QAARLHRRTELGLLNRHEIDELARAGELERLHRQDARSLGQGFDLQHARHDRPTREVTLEELLVEADRLDCMNLLVDAQVDYLVDEEKRVTVRKGLEDLRDVVSARGFGLTHPCEPSPARSAALHRRRR